MRLCREGKLDPVMALFEQHADRMLKGRRESQQACVCLRTQYLISQISQLVYRLIAYGTVCARVAANYIESDPTDSWQFF